MRLELKLTSEICLNVECLDEKISENYLKTCTFYIFSEKKPTIFKEKREKLLYFLLQNQKYLPLRKYIRQ